MVGFEGAADFIGLSALSVTKQIFLTAISFSWFFALLELWLGVNHEFLLLFIVGNLFDFTFGVFVNFG